MPFAAFALRVTTLLRHAVEEAAAADLGDCRRLLPSAFPSSGPLPELSVVRHRGRVVGASSLVFGPSWFLLDIAVDEAWRRRGVGRVLAGAAIAACVGETDAVRPAPVVLAGEPAAALCVAAGFSEVTRRLRFESSSESFLDGLSAVASRYLRRPSSAFSVVAACDVPLPAVVGLASSVLGVLPGPIAARCDPMAPDPYDLRLSPVVLRDGMVVGAILVSVRGDVADFDLDVVHPAFRHGPVQMLLVEAAARLTRAAGFPRWRFACEPHIRDSVALAGRMSAVRLADEIVFERRV